MTKLMGHLGMALLWSSPAWFLWQWRESLAFIGLALSTSMLPDVDLVLEDFLPVVHHGVTHTVVFVAAVSLLVGATAVTGLRSDRSRAWFRDHGVDISHRDLFTFVTGGFLVGGLSHIFTDMLSAPDVADPLEPFWPLIDKPWTTDVIFYSNFWWNVGLLAVAITLHLVLAYVTIDFDRPFRVVHEA